MKIAILGAGISGLSTAFYLRKKHPHIQLQIFEKEVHAGGLIQTKTAGGFVFEMAARGIRPSGKGRYFLKLVKELGLIDRLLPANETAKIRYLFHQEKLEKLPYSMLSTIRHRLFPAVLKGLCQDLFTRPAKLVDQESVYGFISRRFGKTLAEELADPILSGIYAGDIRKLSACEVLPTLTDLENRYQSVIKGLLLDTKRPSELPMQSAELEKFPLLSFRGGMQTFIHALAKAVTPAMHYKHQITQIDPDGHRLFWLDQQQKAQSGYFDRIISTLPAYVLKDICHPVLSKILNKLTYAPLVVSHLAYIKKNNPHQGFGYLIPSKARQTILGVLFNDQIFPDLSPLGSSNYTVMMGGAHELGFKNLTTAHFAALACEGLANQFKNPLLLTPDFQIHKHWAQAIPHYQIGHTEIMHQVAQICQDSGLIISGNFVGGIAVNDCIRNGSKLADQLLQYGFC